MSLLTVSELTKEYGVRAAFGKKSTVRAVDGVSFAIEPGETFAVVGESGSGKSTTAKIIAKLERQTSGTVVFDEIDVTHAGGAELVRYRNNMQVVFQDPFSSLNPRHTVERILTAPLRYQGIKHKPDLPRELMEQVGLDPDHVRRYPAQFSGGQAQRIGIARALAVDPKLIICDEAVSALDVTIQAQVIELLKRLQQERGLAYMFIAHDLAVVRSIADRVAVMSKGRIVEQGSCREVFDDPQDPYTRTLLAAIPRIDPEWDRRRKEHEEKESA